MSNLFISFDASHIFTFSHALCSCDGLAGHSGGLGGNDLWRKIAVRPSEGRHGLLHVQTVRHQDQSRCDEVWGEACVVSVGRGGYEGGELAWMFGFCFDGVSVVGGGQMKAFSMYSHFHFPSFSQG